MKHNRNVERVVLLTASVRLLSNHSCTLLSASEPLSPSSLISSEPLPLIEALPCDSCKLRGAGVSAVSVAVPRNSRMPPDAAVVSAPSNAEELLSAAVASTLSIAAVLPSAGVQHSCAMHCTHAAECSRCERPLERGRVGQRCCAAEHRLPKTAGRKHRARTRAQAVVHRCC